MRSGAAPGPRHSARHDCPLRIACNPPPRASARVASDSANRAADAADGWESVGSADRAPGRPRRMTGARRGRRKAGCRAVRGAAVLCRRGGRIFLHFFRSHSATRGWQSTEATLGQDTPRAAYHDCMLHCASFASTCTVCSSTGCTLTEPQDRVVQPVAAGGAGRSQRGAGREQWQPM